MRLRVSTNDQEIKRGLGRTISGRRSRIRVDSLGRPKCAGGRRKMGRRYEPKVSSIPAGSLILGLRDKHSRRQPVRWRG